MDLKIRNNKYSEFQRHLEDGGQVKYRVTWIKITWTRVNCSHVQYKMLRVTGAILITNCCFKIMMMEYDKMKDNIQMKDNR